MTSAHRGARRTRRRRWPLALAAALVVGAAGGAYALTLDDESSADESASPTAESSTASAPAAWGPTDAERTKAKQLADGLTLDELAGQLIVARHFSDEQSLALVRDKHFAGAMVTGDRILDVASDDPLASVTAFNRQLAAAGRDRGVPTMIPIDQEGGLVARLKAPLTQFPTAMTGGAAVTGDATKGAAAVEAAARASGTELRAAGFNAVFAPDGDATIGPADPIIGSRSPGSDPAVVAKVVTAAVRGYGEAGIISTVKHFPGHNVDEDSHQGLPTLSSDLARLAQHDLVPFAAAIEAGAPGIMTGHLDVPALDRGVPASLSRPVVTGQLRERMGFDGLVVSDSLGMGAVMDRYPGGEAAVAAIKAGSDLALMPADNDAAYDAMLAALKSGDLPEKQARASAARVIAYLLHTESSRRLPGEPGSHTGESKALSAAGLTVVAAPCGTPPPTSFRVSGSPELVAAFTQAAAKLKVPLGSGPAVTLLGYGSRGGYGDVVVTTDTPYALASSQAPTKIALFGGAQPAMEALIEHLTGRTEATGRLPVDGPKQQERCSD